MKDGAGQCTDFWAFFIHVFIAHIITMWIQYVLGSGKDGVRVIQGEGRVMKMKNKLTTTTSIQSSVLCLVAQLCLTLCKPMDYSLPGSSVHGILQTRILEWVAMPSSREDKFVTPNSPTISRLHLAGVSREVTVHFCDFQGCTYSGRKSILCLIFRYSQGLWGLWGLPR